MYTVELEYDHAFIRTLDEKDRYEDAVSYTHLTLPTIYSV